MKNLIEHRYGKWIFAFTRSHFIASLVLVIFSAFIFLPGQMSLQPMDRDEPRFAQASKQMLETGDFVDIRFQNEARHKKPVGIYWLQAASVHLGEILGVKDAREQIWLYRIPSLIGAIAMVLLTYWAALAFLSREGALLAALLLASTILLGVEARLAKTDAVLGALSVLCLGGLARAYFAAKTPLQAPSPSFMMVLSFWIAMGCAILIKGPITPILVLITSISLFINDRNYSFFSTLKPKFGLLIVSIIVLPWISLILIKTGGSFFSESLGKDMLGKISEAKEKHWAPTGAYFLTFWLTSWPIAPFALLITPFAWRERSDDSVTFLLSWIIPFWLILEAIPTKLPHYILPLLPALAIFIVLGAERTIKRNSNILLKITTIMIIIIPIILLIFIPFLFFYLEEETPLIAVLIISISVISALWSGYYFISSYNLLQRGLNGIWGIVISALLISFAIYGFVFPNFNAIRLSPRLAEAAKLSNCTPNNFTSAGYNEPSLVFLTNSKINFTDAKNAAYAFAQQGECSIFFIEKNMEKEFIDNIQGDKKPDLLSRVRGININAALDKQKRLRIIDIGVYVRK